MPCGGPATEDRNVRPKQCLSPRAACGRSLTLVRVTDQLPVAPTSLNDFLRSGVKRVRV